MGQKFKKDRRTADAVAVRRLHLAIQGMRRDLMEKCGMPSVLCISYCGRI